MPGPEPKREIGPVFGRYRSLDAPFTLRSASAVDIRDELIEKLAKVA